MSDRQRHYGTDETDEWDTLAEVTEQEDGTLALRVVQLQKDGGHSEVSDTSEGSPE